MKLKYIQLQSGSIVFPKNPPKTYPGFYRDDVNANLFHPDFIPCRHREKKVFEMPCGKDGVCWWCTLLNKEVTVPVCFTCDVETK